MPLSEHVYCVAVTFKWLSESSNESASDFVLSLNMPWLNNLDVSDGPSYGQLVFSSFITTTCLLMHHVSCSFLVKHQITQVTQPPYSPYLAPWDFWLFPKLKSPLKGKRFQTIDEIQEKTTGQLMVTGRTVWGPKGDWGVIDLCTMFLVSCIFFNKCLYFS